MEYLVTWAIDIEADSPLEAAQIAQSMFLGEDITEEERNLGIEPPRYFQVKEKDGLGQQILINLSGGE